MIRAVIFDLDGTLVQTERLKARSYARAAIELCPYDLTEEEVFETYKEVVGLPRREVALRLVDRFRLEEAAESHMDEFGVTTPWQAFVQIRLRIYKEMLADPELIRKNQWPHNVNLLHEAKRMNCKIGLATMSRCDQTRRILEILELTEKFDFIATRDDVEHGKPDPEIYLLVANELDVSSNNCLVIEDSPSGVQAALAASMHVIAVSTPFTRQSLHQSNLLPPSQIVDDPSMLPETVARFFSRFT